MLNRSFYKDGYGDQLKKFLLSVLNATMYCLLGFIIAGQIGVNSASIVALLGSASIVPEGLASGKPWRTFQAGIDPDDENHSQVGDSPKDGEGTQYIPLVLSLRY